MGSFGKKDHERDTKLDMTSSLLFTQLDMTLARLKERTHKKKFSQTLLSSFLLCKCRVERREDPLSFVVLSIHSYLSRDGGMCKHVTQESSSGTRPTIKSIPLPTTPPFSVSALGFGNGKPSKVLSNFVESFLENR